MNKNESDHERNWLEFTTLSPENISETEIVFPEHLEDYQGDTQIDKYKNYFAQNNQGSEPNVVKAVAMKAVMFPSGVKKFKSVIFGKD